MRFKITMNDGSERTMMILDPEATPEGEVAKWADGDQVVMIEPITEQAEDNS